ncbi:kinase [Nocardia beijingensis]
MNRAVILYGAPATGKDTVTAALVQLDPRFRLFERMKAGPGRTTGYRMTTSDTLDALCHAGEIVWLNERYNARYAIDRPELRALIKGGKVPVVHAGQPEVIPAVTGSMSDVRWTVVELRCSRETAYERIIARETGDTPARLAAWDSTPKLTSASTVINTDLTTPGEAAQLIRSTVLR